MNPACKDLVYDAILFLGYAIYYLLTTPGTLMERLQLGITPVIQPRPDAIQAMTYLNEKYKKPHQVPLQEAEAITHL
jgi:hypothetical protein